MRFFQQNSPASCKARFEALERLFIIETFEKGKIVLSFLRVSKIRPNQVRAVSWDEPRKNSKTRCKLNHQMHERIAG